MKKLVLISFGIVLLCTIDDVISRRYSDDDDDCGYGSGSGSGSGGGSGCGSGSSSGDDSDGDNGTGNDKDTDNYNDTDNGDVNKNKYCPAHWLNYKDKCYHLNKTTANFEQATKFCKGYDGYIVILDDAEEEQFVQNKVMKANDWTWTRIGITDENTEGRWRTVKGDPLTYTNWRLGEPSNGGYYGNEENCAYLGSNDLRWDEEFDWNDTPCSDGVPFVCEKEASDSNDDNSGDNDSGNDDGTDTGEANKYKYCPRHWLNYEDKCYHLSKSYVGFEQATKFCQGYNGYIVILEDAEEEQFVQNKVMKANNFTWARIGITDENIEGRWRTVKGSPLTYTNWRVGEPSTGSFGRQENCAYLGSNDLRWGGQFDWNDTPCHATMPFICEKQADEFPLPETGDEDHLECKVSDLGVEYMGYESETLTKRKCVKWEDKFNYISWASSSSQDLPPNDNFPMVPNGSAIDRHRAAKNYCRNPEQSLLGPWCYVFKSKPNDNELEKELCSVPLCTEKDSKLETASAIYNGKEYIFVLPESEMTYPVAKAYCKTKAASMLELKNSEEEAWIEKQMRARGYESVILGLNDMKHEGYWKNEDGTTPQYSNWGYGEPKQLTADWEDCAYVGLQYGSGSSWNDITCNTPIPVICQRPFKDRLVQKKPFSNIIKYL